MSQMTGRAAAAQDLRDLVLLRRVRDRIDREYAQPLDVEALARDAYVARALQPQVPARLRRVALQLPDDAGASSARWRCCAAAT